MVVTRLSLFITSLKLLKRKLCDVCFSISMWIIDFDITRRSRYSKLLIIQSCVMWNISTQWCYTCHKIGLLGIFSQAPCGGCLYISEDLWCNMDTRWCLIYVELLNNCYIVFFKPQTSLIRQFREIPGFTINQLNVSSLPNTDYCP